VRRREWDWKTHACNVPLAVPATGVEFIAKLRNPPNLRFPTDVIAVRPLEKLTVA
jgi:hypothetical protein